MRVLGLNDAIAVSGGEVGGGYGPGGIPLYEINVGSGGDLQPGEILRHADGYTWIEGPDYCRADINSPPAPDTFENTMKAVAQWVKDNCVLQLGWPLEAYCKLL